VLLFVAVLAIIALALDRSSRSILVEVWKAEAGHRIAGVCQERFVHALGELGKDIAEIKEQGPQNALASAILSAKHDRSVTVVIPTTVPAGPVDAPLQVSEVRASFRVVAGDLDHALDQHPLSESRFVITSSALEGRQVAVRPPPPPPSSPESVPPLARATDFDTALCAHDHAVCMTGTTTTVPHPSSVAVVAVTLEATGTMIADRHRVRRTITETKLVHVVAHHEPKLEGDSWIDVPRRLELQMSPFYISRRVREDGRE
jgi:hypothetical protein